MPANAAEIGHIQKIRPKTQWNLSISKKYNRKR